MAKRRAPEFVQRRLTKTKGWRWRAWLTLRGKRVPGPWRGSKDEARADVTRMRGLIESGEGPRARLTMADARDLVLAEIRATTKTATAESYYRPRIDQLVAAFSPSKLVHFVTRELVEAFRAERLGKCSGNTVKKDLQVIFHFFEILIRKGQLGQNPAKGVGVVTTPPKPMAWFRVDPDQDEVGDLIERLLSAESVQRRGEETFRNPFPTRERDADIILVPFMTGMRRAEMVRCNIEHIDFEHGMLAIEGKHGPRQIEIGPDLETLLRRMIDGRASGPLIVGGKTRIVWVFSTWSRRLNEPRLTAHAMRVSCATFLIRNVTADPKVIAEIMGHARLEQVMRYFRLVPGDRAAAMRQVRLPAARKARLA